MHKILHVQVIQQAGLFGVVHMRAIYTGKISWTGVQRDEPRSPDQAYRKLVVERIFRIYHNYQMPIGFKNAADFPLGGQNVRNVVQNSMREYGVKFSVAKGN